MDRFWQCSGDQSWTCSRATTGARQHSDRGGLRETRSGDRIRRPDGAEAEADGRRKLRPVGPCDARRYRRTHDRTRGSGSLTFKRAIAFAISIPAVLSGCDSSGQPAVQPNNVSPAPQIEAVIRRAEGISQDSAIFRGLPSAVVEEA